MRLVSYRLGDDAGVGVMVDDTSFVALPEVAPKLPRTLRGILEIGDAALEQARATADGKAASFTFDDVVLDPVVPEPQAIWALALNYKGHIEETGLTTSPDYPHVFLRQPASQVGHLQPMLCPDPKVARAYDYEGELAVIIGKGGRHIPVERARDHVAGYACYNEGSVREFQSHNRQFGLGKNFEKSGSFGPWMMTTDEFGNPYEQKVLTRLNGILRQDCGFDQMLFNVEQLIHYLSTGYELRPGDVIVTGTPGALPWRDGESFPQYGGIKVAGVVHMQPGDEVEVEITGLGTLKNPIVADDPAP